MRKLPQGESPCGFFSSCYDCDMVRVRDHMIDLLRVLALVLILTAHCWFGDIYENFREFDVILMFFLSGMSFALSGFTFTPENYTAYIRKRFRKLVIPVWIFLVFFFLLFRVVPIYEFSVMDMVKSFALTSGGIMFVWVYRVFFIAALTTPLLDKVLRNHKPMISTVIGIICIMLNDLLYRNVFVQLGSETATDVLSYLVTYTVGYGIVTYLGVLFLRMNVKERRFFTLLMCVLSAGTAVYCRFAFFETYKFPPQLYYIAYGLLWSSLLYLVFSKVPVVHPLITWISENCMTIYLGHILVYYLLHPYIHSQLLFFIALLGGSLCFAFAYRKLPFRM